MIIYGRGLRNLSVLRRKREHTLSVQKGNMMKKYYEDKKVVRGRKDRSVVGSDRYKNVNTYFKSLNQEP